MGHFRPPFLAVIHFNVAHCKLIRVNFSLDNTGTGWPKNRESVVDYPKRLWPRCRGERPIGSGQFLGSTASFSDRHDFTLARPAVGRVRLPKALNGNNMQVD
jgi:hypothetical protein